jgi:CubicO group peptidase (beta-lactamase class C family)
MADTAGKVPTHHLSSHPQHVVSGLCAPGFEGVRDAFLQNFVDSDELGASLAIEIDGQPVLDLWGGYADAERRQPWLRDSVSVVFSNTKPATALCAHLLAQDGLLDLDRPVHHYWPAFADSARRTITPRMFLDHSAGLPALRDKLPDGAAFDWDAMVTLLGQEQPFWEPGTRVGYHGLTYGWLVGEVVRHVAGIPIGEFFQQRIAAPLQLDFWIGLPAEQEHRVAAIVPGTPAAHPRNPFEAIIANQPDSIAALYFRNTGGWRPSGFNSRQGHAAQIPAANGITNARNLARLYGTLAMGGARDGWRLIEAERLAAATEVSAASHLDACLQVPTRFGAGFMRAMDNRARGLDSILLGADGFGHAGAGGSVAFASPRHRMGFAYTMNRMGAGVLLNRRAERLIEAANRALLS